MRASSVVRLMLVLLVLLGGALWLHQQALPALVENPPVLALSSLETALATFCGANPRCSADLAQHVAHLPDFAAEQDDDDYLSLRWATPTAVSTGQLTLCTQSSLDQVPHLLDTLSAFDGPVTIAIFSAAPVAKEALAVVWAKLASCHPDIGTRVAARYTMHRDTHQQLLDLSPDQAEVSAMDLARQLALLPCTVDSLVSSLRMWTQAGANYELTLQTTQVPYPNNLLRNLARDQATTLFTMVLDVDIVPSHNIAKAVEQAVAAHHGSYTRLAFVVPAFELDTSTATTMPAHRDELLQMLEAGTARPFYQEVCWKCQRHTNYEKWQQGPMQITELEYEVSWHDPWEPFYIARERSCPRYDVRFRQYGFNRISQVCHMHMLNYRFVVLYQAFVVHAGWKRPGAFHASKQADLDRNRDLFRQMKRELRAHIPQGPSC
ncbi:uncharacterized protein MONBRDRAFT_26884 [Monosiga brevicollis MX1]|uniref:Beta-1,4-glucuronyltransferase 1 n=1 Tax=Monosiga brevicollis TaxID=81824 RepID=A9V3T7_MONBE|nr:uncharacterized protein MONBRDRAFT_26884 [Monosiga brevicollis MX1]EDQ87765.1 predicted protein [Monosiga brevicollis MX1]|eukprot:XP_001747298.1 hypothetical protein [Monosiga brevicollis MX1]